MISPEEQAVIDAARAWLAAWRSGLAEDEKDKKITPASSMRAIQDALEALDGPAPGPRTDKARQLTWGQVPAGWYVQAPDGKWYEVQATGRTGASQMVHMAMGSWRRDPAGLVTACPGPHTPTDAAIEALGFPRVLEDGA